MKKLIYTCLSALLILAFSPTKGSAQTISSYYDYGNACYFSFDSITVSLSGIVGGEHMSIYFGDGTSQTDTVIGYGGGSGYMGYAHLYTVAGVYTVKMVLMNAAGTHVDSISYTNNWQFCEAINLYVYNDVNSNCTFDYPNDDLIYYDEAQIEVDSAGHILDTIALSYWGQYLALGPVGTPYAFKLVHNPYGFLPSCPAGGIIYDTIAATADTGHHFGFTCDPSVGVDNAVSGSMRAGLTGAWSWCDVTSTSCAGVPLTLTIIHSPKYAVAAVSGSGISTPAYTVSGNVITVTLPSVATTTSQWISIDYTPVGTLTLGDTVQTKWSVTPLTGDVNPANNVCTSVDTIRSSYDPNEKSVYPNGNIAPGTKLQYMITFENTGNDTAHNIHVMDTLSDNVDINSIKIVSTTAKMNMSLLKDGTHNIVKFDFPSINLLDSTHHGKCTGSVTFSINSKTGLATGTKIDNKAGIYFDANYVVMTNNVENKIGIPTAVNTMSNTTNVEVYPNPVSNELTIQVNGGAYNKASITNVMGQVIMTQELNSATTKVNVNKLPAGIYILTLKGDSGVKVQQFEKR